MNDHKIRDEVRQKRQDNIPEPAFNENGKPILTSVWIPTKEQVQEYNKIPFYEAITFRGRTFPHVVRNLIQLYSNEGDIVYDPMLGSGTTLFEARKLKRQVTGSDLNPNTVENFKQRWKQFVNDNPPYVEQADACHLKIANNNVDLIIMSFPWFSSWEFAESKETNSMENKKEFEDFLTQSLLIYKECFRVLKPGGFVCNILGNTFRKGVYYPVTMRMFEMISKAGLQLHYQFWNLRVDIETIREPWKRSALDTNIKKADVGVGWDIHEDIIVARKSK